MSGKMPDPQALDFIRSWILNYSLSAAVLGDIGEIKHHQKTAISQGDSRSRMNATSTIDFGRGTQPCTPTVEF
jgi:hypothetical protein